MHILRGARRRLKAFLASISVGGGLPTPDKVFLQKLADMVSEVDPGIRYAAFADLDGNIVAGGMRTGVQSYDSDQDQRMRTIQRSISGYMFRDWERNYGRHEFTVTVFEKLVLIQITYEELVLNVSTEPGIKVNQALKKILELLSKSVTIDF